MIASEVRLKKKATDTPTADLVFYQSKDGKARLEVRIEGETVWLSLNQMADLFDRDKSVVSRHIKNIFEEGELEQAAVVAKNATTAADGKTYKVENYNLDVIISVGYRVKSLRGTQFRIWATERLREYIVKGFTLDDERLKKGGTIAERYYAELFERIREIRASERMFYQKVCDIYSTSIDYDPKADLSRDFFAVVQNKMHWGAHGHTAAEIIAERADAAKPDMGLTNHRGGRLQKADALIAKNYLKADELDILNRMVSQYLDFAELQAVSKKAMTMQAWIKKLDDFLRLNDREILAHGGKVSADMAEKIATETYELYRQKRALDEARRVDNDFEQATKNLEKNAAPMRAGIPLELEASFRATHYRVSEHPHNFIIRIGEASQPVEALFWDYSLASAIYITAYNPFSVKKPDAVNEAANAKLRQRLEALGAVAISEGEGKDPDPQATWPSEASFLALGLDEKTGQALAQEFWQWAFVLMERGKTPALVWNTNKT